MNISFRRKSPLACRFTYYGLEKLGERVKRYSQQDVQNSSEAPSDQSICVIDIPRTIPR